MGKDFSKEMSKDANPERGNQEADERLPEVNVDAPKSRYQTKQQVNNAINSVDNKVPETGFVKKPVTNTGSALKQEVASTILTGKGAGAASASDVVSPNAYGLKSLKYSGDTGTILGNASDTPTMRQSAQGETRVDKRLSDPNKDINYLASEQPLVEYTNVAPLAGSESTVGYNGNPKNTSVRTQKASGASPAEILYDRSLDFIVDDVALYSAGQVIKQNGVEYGDYPKTTLVQNGSTWSETAFNMERGNYSPRNIKISLGLDNGRAYVAGFEVEEDDLSIYNESYDVVNRASTNEKIFLNTAEMARQRIDAKAGSPSQPFFNPLGRSTKEPTATVGYLKDVETTTGNTMFTAYKMANKAKAFYLFRTAKDGQDLITPAIDAMYGHLMAPLDSADLRADFDAVADTSKSPFYANAGLKAGSVAVLLGCFDSWGKYKTKADIVTQPRGLKLHLQTADNTINAFRCDPNFVAALNSVDVFSTIDRGYDPMNAICATDGVRLVYPYSWKKSLKFTRPDSTSARVYDDQLFAYQYSAGNGLNRYVVKVADPILNAVAYFAEMHAQELYSALATADEKSKSTTVVWNIPTVHYGLHFGLWDYLLCACAPYIVYERTNSMKDILDFQVNFEYPFPETVSIADANPMNAVNYRNVSSMEPLTPGAMLPSSAIRWTMPETLVKIGDDGLMLPFYFSEDDYSPKGTKAGAGILNNTDRHSFTTPVIRSGIKLAFLDDFFSMEVKDTQLCYDRMVRTPFIAKAAASSANSSFDGVIYKYSQDAEGIPVATGIKNLTTVTGIDYMSTPRQLGWFCPAISGFCSRTATLADAARGTFAGPNDLATLKLSDFAIKPATRAIMYKGLAAKNDVAPATLDPASIVVNRAQSFTQKWFVRYASGLSATNFDLPLSLGDSVDGAAGKVTGVGTGAIYTPFIFTTYAAGGSSNVDTTLQLFSVHNMLWSIIQKTPYIISPFDFGSDGAGYVDPFAVAYIFGLAGFMSADYAEEDYNRVNQVMNQGYGYTADPFVLASPVFADARKKTQV